MNTETGFSYRYIEYISFDMFKTRVALIARALCLSLIARNFYTGFQG